MPCAMRAESRRRGALAATRTTRMAGWALAALTRACVSCSLETALGWSHRQYPGSSAGQSSGLLIRRSRVRVAPGVPLSSAARYGRRCRFRPMFTGFSSNPRFVCEDADGARLFCQPRSPPRTSALQRPATLRNGVNGCFPFGPLSLEMSLHHLPFGRRRDLSDYGMTVIFMFMFL